MLSAVSAPPPSSRASAGADAGERRQFVRFMLDMHTCQRRIDDRVKRRGLVQRQLKERKRHQPHMCADVCGKHKRVSFA
jgi:hypothetical protein